MDKQPTQVEVKELWKWCEVSLEHDWDNEVHGYQTNGYFCTRCGAVEDYTPNRDPCLLPIDLNNLFKYAVPRFWVCEISLVEGIFWSVTVSMPCPPDGAPKTGKALVEKDLPLALFWAIWEAIHETHTDSPIIK